ncbi:MAG: phosphatidate cytidylyltransferase [Clostridia bacterium]|jgi:phosphatidate cytidylyltransferase|nr:phosphatidate cytidylyltransferase [Clostridia bacterium]
MLSKRILTALIGIPALIFIFYQGGLILLGVVILLILLGLYEYRNLVNRSGHHPMSLPLCLGGLLMPLAVQYYGESAGTAAFIYAVVTLVYYLFRHHSFSPLDLALSFLGFLYIVLGFTNLLFLRSMEQGFWLLVYIFVIVWSTDTAAYFIGTYFGRHSLAPDISPKKSWEGFIAGIVFSLLTVYILTAVAHLERAWLLLVITPIISVAGQLGDLFESTLKRFAGIKDSGNIFPGHGGILDRFDSALWAAPFAYHLIICLERLF